MSFSQAEGDSSQTTIPIIEETLEVEKRKTTKGVRVTKKVDERQSEIDVPALHQEVTVERVPVNRIVDGPVATREEGNTTVISLVDEEVTLQKRWVLREEVRITKSEVTLHETKAVSLKHESARVETQND